MAIYILAQVNTPQLILFGFLEVLHFPPTWKVYAVLYGPVVISTSHAVMVSLPHVEKLNRKYIRHFL